MQLKLIIRSICTRIC